MLLRIKLRNGNLKKTLSSSVKVTLILQVLFEKEKNAWHIQVIFFDSTKLEIVWKKTTTSFKRRVSMIL